MQTIIGNVLDSSLPPTKRGYTYSSGLNNFAFQPVTIGAGERVVLGSVPSPLRLSRSAARPVLLAAGDAGGVVALAGGGPKDTSE